MPFTKFKVSGFFAPLPFRPLALSPLADSPMHLGRFAPWVIDNRILTLAFGFVGKDLLL